MGRKIRGGSKTYGVVNLRKRGGGEGGLWPGGGQIRAGGGKRRWPFGRDASCARAKCCRTRRRVLHGDLPRLLSFCDDICYVASFLHGCTPWNIAAIPSWLSHGRLAKSSNWIDWIESFHSWTKLERTRGNINTLRTPLCSLNALPTRIFERSKKSI